MRSNVTFKSNGLKVAGHLYLLDDYKEGEKRPAIVVGHPCGGVKEQTAGLYAKKLSEKGFITLAFDASYQGESEGEPRYLEDPFARAEDVKSAVTFLETRDEVDEQRIGALGICASGGYVPFSAETDRRIKAVGTVSAVDMGDFVRSGLRNSVIPNLEHLLEESNKARIEEAKGQPPRLEHIVPNTPEEVPKDAPSSIREATDYYRTPRAQHPNSQNWILVRSIDRIAEYSSYDHVDMISPHPLLMIAGTKADTRYFSEMAIEKAKEPKELFLIEGATHISLYDKKEYVDPAVEKLNSFFNQYLQ
jgi:fermentation-respiration switch protein FrsA (DUF1100 family)